MIKEDDTLPLTTYMPIIMLWVILFIVIHQRKKSNEMIVLNQIIKNTEKENTQMLELAKKFIGKECLIYAFNGTQYTGIITEVSDNAILIDNNGQTEAINLAFIVRIREYPKDKKGKKKSVVLD